MEPDPYYWRGVTWARKNEYDKAIKDYTEAIKLDPKHAMSYYGRGLIYLIINNHDKAIKDFDQVILLGPKAASAYYFRGGAWSLKGEYDKAIKDFDQAILLEPDDADYYFRRAVAWTNKKEYDKAIKDYDDVIRLNPKYIYGYGSRALVWSKKKDYARAVKDFDEALRVNANDWIYRDYALFRATCPDAKFRDGKKAVEMAKKACDMNPNGWKDGAYLSALAAAHAEAGDFDEAVRRQQEALADTTVHATDRADYQARLKLFQQKKPYRDE